MVPKVRLNMHELVLARHVVQVLPVLVDVAGAAGAPMEPSVDFHRRTWRTAPPETSSTKASLFPSSESIGEVLIPLLPVETL